MKLNGTTRAISIILGIVVLLGTFIWQASAFTMKVEYRLQKGEAWDAAQDSSITNIKSKIDYLVQRERMKEIIDSLTDSQPEITAQAQKIMKNNTDTVPPDTSTNVHWTNDIGED